MIKSIKLLAIVISITGVLSAEVPMLINYPGKLSEKNGSPITGTKSIKFALYDAETAGTEKWSGTYSVEVTKGVFNVLLGSGASPFSITLDFNASYWLQITVEGEVLSPRQRISSVGYSIRSEYSNRAEVVNTPVVYTGSGDVDANVSEKIYIHIDKIPRSVKLFLYGEKMSTLFYTELGAHNHTASSGSAGDHGHNMLVDNTASWWGAGTCIKDTDDGDSSRAWRSWPIQNSGSNNHSVSIDNQGNSAVSAGNTNKTFPSSVRVLVDGGNKTGFIGNPNSKSYWNSTNSTWGDGAHEFSTGELNLSPYILTAGEHKIEFTEGTGGRIRFNVYVYY